MAERNSPKYPEWHCFTVRYCDKCGELYEPICSLKHICKKQNSYPVADVVEVERGEWEKVKYIEGCLNPYKHTCGCCGKSYFDNNSNNYPFCPLCGAKMDGERRSE